MTYLFCHYYARIKVNSYDSKLQNPIILIRSICNKHKDQYYYIFLEKCSHK